MPPSKRKAAVLLIGFVSPFFLGGAEAESLRYTIKWPSGLNLGEATLSTELAERGYSQTLDIDASLPAYTIHDRYVSVETAALCTIEFERTAEHGPRKTAERIRVAPDGTITRETTKGGSSTIAAGSCPHDALALLFSARRELQQNRLPAAQTVLFGAGYPVRFELAAPENISVSEKPAQADKVICILTLPKLGDYRIEMFFLRDQTRTPALIRAPFALGTFSMELVR